MLSFLSKVTRPLMAAAATACVCAGTATAVDYYHPYPNQPVYYGIPSYGVAQPAVVGTASCGQTACVQPVACNSCGPSGDLTALRRTTLPGRYSNDYDYSVSSQVDNGITYIVPTQTGYTESSTMPLTNPVDQYYATHQVRNGQIVQTGDLSRAGMNLARHEDGEAMNQNMRRAMAQTGNAATASTGAVATVPASAANGNAITNAPIDMSRLHRTSATITASDKAGTNDSFINRANGTVNQLRRANETETTSGNAGTNDSLINRANDTVTKLRRANNTPVTSGNTSANDLLINRASDSGNQFRRSNTAASASNSASDSILNDIKAMNNDPDWVHRAATASTSANAIPATGVSASLQNADATPGLNETNTDLFVPGVLNAADY